jgi:hypothetical protein
VDRDGVPYLLVGDMPWCLIVSPTWDEAVAYLEDRAARGFNALTIELIESLFGIDAPRNRCGDEPFLVPGDFSQPNEAYFAHADRVLRKAGELGFLVLLNPCYLGYDGSSTYPGYRGRPEGWHAEVLANGPEKCETYGRYLGRRYRDYPNILWLMAGDRSPGDVLEHQRAMVKGIQSEDMPGRLFTAHVAPHQRVQEAFPDDPWLTVGNVYSYSIIHRDCRDEYRRRSGQPFFLFETSYEDEYHNCSEVQMRRQVWWPVLQGAFGASMGNYTVWIHGPGWQQALGSPAARSMTVLRDTLGPRRWWDLEPDIDPEIEFAPDLEHHLIVDGLGELNGLDYCAVALTPDGALTVAYLPTPRPITLDLDFIGVRLAAAGTRLRATWVDPVSGSQYSAGTLQATGRWTVRPPTDNDSVLILEAEDPGSALR